MAPIRYRTPRSWADGHAPRSKGNDINSPDPSVAPSAVVEPGAVIGDRTAVWHHAHVRTGAFIGADCVLGQNSFVDAGVHVGDRVKLENNASVHAGATLADEVFLGPGAVITNDRRPRSQSVDFVPVRTHVGRGASIGANATVVCGHDIGEYAMVGAGAVVTHGVPAHALVVGNPARAAGWVCRCGDVVSRAPERPARVVCERCS